MGDTARWETVSEDACNMAVTGVGLLPDSGLTATAVRQFLQVLKTIKTAVGCRDERWLHRGQGGNYKYTQHTTKAIKHPQLVATKQLRFRFKPALVPKRCAPIIDQTESER